MIKEMVGVNLCLLQTPFRQSLLAFFLLLILLLILDLFILLVTLVGLLV